VKDLVIKQESGDLVTTSLIISEGVNMPHASVIKLIRQNVKRLENFGMVRFEIQPKPEGQRSGSDANYAILNEQQAVLLIDQIQKELFKEFNASFTLEGLECEGGVQ